jgi:hypothetical protein
VKESINWPFANLFKSGLPPLCLQKERVSALFYQNSGIKKVPRERMGIAGKTFPVLKDNWRG